MKRLMLFSLFAAATLSAAQTRQTFTGTITDSDCPKADHSEMQMGPTDAVCVTSCVREQGSTFVLYDGKEVYKLSDQKTPEKFAAQKVTVTGTLDNATKTIHVDAIAAAK